MYPHNMQDMSSDCGIAVLKSLLQHYKRYDEEDLVQSISKREFSQGLALIDLADVLEDYNVYGAWYEVEDTEEIPFTSPLIIVTEEEAGNHYSIVYEQKDGLLCVSNPAASELEYIEKTELFKKFAGYVYVVERVDKRKKMAKKIKPKLNISRKEKFDVSVYTTLQFILPLFIVFSLQYVMMFRGLYAEYPELMLIICFYGVIICMEIINKYIGKQQSLMFDYRGKQQEINLFMQKVDMVQNRRAHNMYNDIITFWTNFNASNKALMIYQLKIEIGFLLLFLLLLAYYSLVMFLFTLSLAILLYVLIMPKLNKLKNYNKVFMNKMGEISTFVEEYTKNKVDRHIFTDDQTVNIYVQKLLNNLKVERKKTERIESEITNMQDVTMYVILISTFAFKVIGEIHELPFKTDGFFFSFFLVYMLFNSLKVTMQKTTELTKYNTIDNNLSMHLKTKEQSGFIQESISTAEPITAISLQNFSFSYDHESAILHQVNAEIKQGSLFLIDGDNGSGKTTLLHCLLGLEKEYQGQVIFKNNNATHVTYSDSVIGHNFSYYASHQYLNYGTIKKNIAYNIYDDDEQQDVVNCFGLDLAKVIFYNGENLSLGEKQKVLLSRCLNKDANIYIFDEPTTNLDRGSKHQLIEMLLELKRQNKVVIVVTHDDDLKKVADDILYLHKVVASKDNTEKRMHKV